MLKGRASGGGLEGGERKERVRGKKWGNKAAEGVTEGDD